MIVQRGGQTRSSAPLSGRLFPFFHSLSAVSGRAREETQKQSTTQNVYILKHRI